MKTTGYAAYAPDKPLAPYDFERRELRSNDVAIEILYSGVCHSDLHTARGDWGPYTAPLVPAAPPSALRMLTEPLLLPVLPPLDTLTSPPAAAALLPADTLTEPPVPLAPAGHTWRRGCSTGCAAVSCGAVRCAWPRRLPPSSRSRARWWRA